MKSDVFRTSRQMARRLACLIACGIVMLTGTGIAPASVSLRYAPADSSFTLGTEGSLAIMIDDTLDIRTIEVWVEYDPAILTSLDGMSGQLFHDTGAFIFEGFEEETAGSWHGYAVVIAADAWCEGPGELFVWSFACDALGTSDVLTVDVRLFDPDAVIIDNVSLSPTTVSVYDPLPVPEHGQLAPALHLYPNPFNPRCDLSFRAPVTGPARIEVFDARGHLLGQVWEGVIREEEQHVSWNGRDPAGRHLPSGVYLFRLSAPGGEDTWTRGLLVK